MIDEYSDKQFWDNYWEKEERNEYDFLFSRLIDQYIDWKGIKNYMEIGGAPGTIMSYMFHNHNLNVNTVDFCNPQILSSMLEKNNVKEYRIYNEDFATFDTTKHKKLYDVVASWGFVEHFDTIKSRFFIQKQKEMVSDNGYIVVELPNIRKFNWLLYRIMNYELLKIHNVKTMNLDFLRQAIEEGGDFEILYGDYYLTSFLEYSSSNEFFDKHHIIKQIFSSLKHLFAWLHLNNISNRFFSPYIVFIARRING